MRRKRQTIHVNHFGDEHNSGISIERISVKDIPNFDGEEQSHRHDRHSFFLIENGTVSMEIDFQKYELKPASIIYMHPNQVHRILAFENVTVKSLAISNENLNPEYLKLLEEITPSKPLSLNKEAFSNISETISLCLKFSEMTHDKLHQSGLRDCCNALVALVLSQLIVQIRSNEKFSRFEIIYNAFKELLERNFTSMKRPAEFAEKLNISTPYLNECVKNTTGKSVSYHIQERLILEAKRLLYHSGKSIKEIANDLGYEDPAYFSRTFTKFTGISAITFRSKNFE